MVLLTLAEVKVLPELLAQLHSFGSHVPDSQALGGTAMPLHALLETSHPCTALQVWSLTAG